MAAARRQRQARMRSRGSILDSVRAEASRVATSLGAGDTAKLGEYLDSVREIEQRIQHVGIAAGRLWSCRSGRPTCPTRSTRTPS